MKNLLLLMLTVGVLSSSCKKEEDPLPTSITIESVDVLSFSTFDNLGQPIDAPDNRPDIGLVLSQASTEFSSTIIQNCTVGPTYNFAVNRTFLLDANVFVDMYDYNGTTINQFMSYYLFFRPVDYINTKPQTITLTDDLSSVRLNVIWNY